MYLQVQLQNPLNAVMIKMALMTIVPGKEGQDLSLLSYQSQIRAYINISQSSGSRHCVNCVNGADCVN